MTLLRAQGLSATAPRGWEVRIFRHADGETTMHAGSFPLPLQDGEYGAAATFQMGATDAFLALTEFHADQHLKPNHGLFAAAQPTRLAAHSFSAKALQRARPGQLGQQLFFTAADRAFSLYVVLGSTRARQQRLPELDQLLQTLTIE